jgi:hypothetical protein
MLYGYDATNLSQSYPLWESSEHHRHLQEQSGGSWQDDGALRSQRTVPAQWLPNQPVKRHERTLTIFIFATIASAWAYLIFF